MSSDMFLDIENLSLELGGVRILENISFSLDRGKYLGIIGPNGAGKSSLLKCLGRLQKNYSGRVLLEGNSISSMPERAVARRIAWVHQTGSDSLPFTVREFALMSRYPWQKAIGGETLEDMEIIDRSLETAGVADIGDRQLNSLSGGERQKALIAAALAQSTDILFLDEPTSFLDYRHQVETLELVERVNREQGITILLVTHDINLALHGADEILAIKRGRTAWKGKSEDLHHKELLSEIFDTEFESFVSNGQKIPYVAPRGLVR
ncbi:MAG: ABC transporter ATP-binding protein [Synergistaceae bacterium]|nr:ABC transporter ATP-binding protein [Synergistaceae bacterium]